MPESDGILLNTFVELETRAVRSLREGLCVPGRAMPPVYCIGPLVSGGGGEKDHECLRWLDSPPDRSVVFLCFGSQGTFSERQLKEIAVDLERSEQRFLWVVHAPGRVDDEKLGLGDRRDTLPELDLGVLLPDGFLERTKGQRPRGQVLGAAGGRGAPQGGRRFHDALRMELDAGGHRGGAAALVLADVCTMQSRR
jgi:hypothetical protein